MTRNMGKPMNSKGGASRLITLFLISVALLVAYIGFALAITFASAKADSSAYVEVAGYFMIAIVVPTAVAFALNRTHKLPGWNAARLAAAATIAIHVLLIPIGLGIMVP